MSRQSGISLFRSPASSSQFLLTTKHANREQFLENHIIPKLNAEVQGLKQRIQELQQSVDQYNEFLGWFQDRMWKEFHRGLRTKFLPDVPNAVILHFPPPLLPRVGIVPDHLILELCNNHSHTYAFFDKKSFAKIVPKQFWTKVVPAANGRNHILKLQLSETSPVFIKYYYRSCMLTFWYSWTSPTLQIVPNVNKAAQRNVKRRKRPELPNQVEKSNKQPKKDPV